MLVLLAFIFLLSVTENVPTQEHGSKYHKDSGDVLWISPLFKANIEQRLNDSGIHYNNGCPGQDEQFEGQVSNFQQEPGHPSKGNMGAVNSTSGSLLLRPPLIITWKGLYGSKYQKDSGDVLRISPLFKANIEQRLNDSGIHYNNRRPGQDEQFEGQVSNFQQEPGHPSNRNMRVNSISGSLLLRPPLIITWKGLYDKMLMDMDSGLLKKKSNECFIRESNPLVIPLSTGVPSEQSSEVSILVSITESSGRTITESSGVSSGRSIERSFGDYSGRSFGDYSGRSFVFLADALFLGAFIVLAVLDTKCITVRFNKVTPVEFFLLLSIFLTANVMTQEHGPNYQTVVVPEGSDAVLPCSLVTKENINFKLFDWRKSAQNDEALKEVFMCEAGKHYNNGRPGQSEQFKGRVSHFPDELKHGNASITIRDTRVTDSGDYTCDFPKLQPRQIFHVELVVFGRDQPPSTLKNKFGEIDGAAPEPYVGMVGVTQSGVLLKCSVGGVSPQPELQWKDSDGNVLPAEKLHVLKRGERYDATLQTTVNSTDRFHCVVTQEDVGHRIEANITVPENLFRDTGSKASGGDSGKDSSKESSGVSIGLFIGGVVAALFLGAFIVLAVLALLVSKKSITLRFNKASHQQENGEIPLKKNGLCKNRQLENGSPESPSENNNSGSDLEEKSPLQG